MAEQDDKTGVTPIFKNMALRNEGKTAQAGRPIFDDVEVVEVRFAGRKDTAVFPAHAFSHWQADEDSEDGFGEQRKVTYAERWPRQYRQFKQHQTQTKSGTPLDYAPFLTDAKRSELRALAIYTIEALAHLDGQELKNLGPGGRELKNQAEAFMAKSSNEAVIYQQKSEIEALKAKLQVLEDDKNYRKHGAGPKKKGDDDEETDNGEEEDETDDEPDNEGDVAAAKSRSKFAGMTEAALVRFITETTGKKPVGKPSKTTLIKMAEVADQ